MMNTYELASAEFIPSDYEDYLTQSEISEYIGGASRHGFVGKPILADEAVKTRRAYNSWSLFLISNPTWLGPDGASKIESLYESYRAFARAIGGKHAAVWFGKVWPEGAKSTKQRKELLARIDTDRCAAYCTKLALPLAESPHVVVTTKHPDVKEPLEDSIVLGLEGLSPESTIALLTELGTQLLSAKLDASNLHSEIWWLKWRDVITRIYEQFSSVLSRSKFTIKTGVLNVTIPPVKRK